MKKLFFVLLLLIWVVTCALAQQSGSCGENLIWTLDEDGTLTISGTGKMYDYSNGDAPWSGTTVNQVILEEGITHIGASAFYECSEFTGNLTLPASLTSIGTRAFYNCSRFTGILTLPASLTSIGVKAFYNCSGFTGNLTLPASLTSIGGGAFSDCSGFTGNLTLPASLTSIEESAFKNCSGFTDTLMLPENLLNIGSRTFSNCEFSVVVNENKTPVVIGADVFENLNRFNTKLCVPAGSEMAYSQAEVWKNFNIEEYGVGITPAFSENGGTIDCGTEISISTKPEAELYYGLGKDAVPTLRYTEPITITDTTYISTYSRVRNVYSDTIHATYIPEHASSFVGMDWDWSAEHKATLSLACSRCKTDIKPAVSLSEELTKEATEEEAGLKTYTATATANEITYKSINREVLPRLTQPIHDTVVKTDTITITEVKTDTIIITDTVYIEVGTGNTVTETMKVKLYPNPTNGSFTVEAEEDAYLQIYNATGVCIQSNQLQGGRFTGTLPASGLYFIKLTSRNRTYTKRLIVQ